MRTPHALPIFAIALASLLLTAGCTTVHLPHPETGRCYTVTHAYVVGWGYAMADAVDGWRCEGLQDGELARTGDRPSKAETPAGVDRAKKQ
jgi:hypothetical protein